MPKQKEQFTTSSLNQTPKEKAKEKKHRDSQIKAEKKKKSKSPSKAMSDVSNEAVDDNIEQEKGEEKGKSDNIEQCTAKQESFARQYLVARCKASAYKYAYDCENMSDNTIYKKALIVYNTTYVYARIMELQEESNKRIEITTDKIQQEIAKLAFTHLPGIANYNGITMTVSEFDNLTDTQRACIKEFEVVQSRQVDSEHPDNVKEIEKIKIKVYDKHAALVSLGKINGMFVEKIQSDINLHGDITVIPPTTKNEN